MLPVTFISLILNLWSFHISSAVQDGFYQATTSPLSYPDTVGQLTQVHDTPFQSLLFGPKVTSPETVMISDLAWDYITHSRRIVLELSAKALIKLSRGRGVEDVQEPEQCSSGYSDVIHLSGSQSSHSYLPGDQDVLSKLRFVFVSF